MCKETIECPECGEKITFNPSNYDDHMIGENDFECPKCHEEIIICGDPGPITYTAHKKDG